MFQIQGGEVIPQRDSFSSFRPAEMKMWLTSSIYRKDDENVLDFFFFFFWLWKTLVSRTWPVTWVIQFGAAVWNRNIPFIHEGPVGTLVIEPGFYRWLCLPWLPFFSFASLVLVLMPLYHSALSFWLSSLFLVYTHRLDLWFLCQTPLMFCYLLLSRKCRLSNKYFWVPAKRTSMIEGFFLPSNLPVEILISHNLSLRP